MFCSIVALSKIMEYAIMENDERLVNLNIDCENHDQFKYKKEFKNNINFVTQPLVARIFQILVQIFTSKMQYESDSEEEVCIPNFSF